MLGYNVHLSAFLPDLSQKGRGLQPTDKMKLFGLIGDPVEHSLSPVMHNTALEELGVDGVYVKKRVGDDWVFDVVRGANLFGFEGLNVTIPHKETVLGCCDWLSREAELADAVNTIKFVDGEVRGYNTDVLGARKLMSDVLDVGDCVATVVGAGGAARGVCLALRDANKLYVANRTASRAKELVNDLREKTGAEARAFGLSDLEGLVGESDLLVNATSVGMGENKSVVEKEWLFGDLVVFDLVYEPVRTKLLRQAKEVGCDTISGLEMLVEQGAESLETWIGEEAPKRAMMEAVEREVGGL